MKKYFIAIFLMFATAIFVRTALVLASPPSLASPPTLALSQLKVTGDEYIIVQNNTGKSVDDLSSYWLDYYNDYDPLAGGISSSSQQLPKTGLGSGESLLLAADVRPTCGASLAGKLGISLGDSKGYLQISQVSTGVLGMNRLPVDYVSWSADKDADAVITAVPSGSKDPDAAYYRYADASGYGWQLADVDQSNVCQLNVAATGGAVGNLIRANGSVPSVVGVNAGINLPPTDTGLAVPQISEVLPNPAPPQTDADNEFIELYNSNDKPFDLSGFVLQVGTSTVHQYGFPADTSIQPHQFSAFYSSDTGLSLSNNSGQVKLLDSAGNVLEQSDVYGAAKDGYAWVKSNGLWQWTTTVTPDAANIITAPLSKKSSTPSSSNKTAVKGALTSGPSSTSPSGSAPSSVNLHPVVLVGVGAAAVVYALYEYRNDLANQFYKFRRYRESRRTAG
ncbi:MAG TPA: lamin tail domain-containing protein [Candidatus Saccharimonadales bacterium]|nr:lamin tail domain-containing protein [Candidatus Saccharimonadales bacterium]